MVSRTVQLAQLKKAYKKQRRKALWCWDLLWYLFMALFAVAFCCLAYVVCYRAPFIRFVDLKLWTPVKNMLGISRNLLPVGRFVLRYGVYFAGGFLAAFALVWILRSAAIRRTRKFESYLDYMTLKTTLKMEKQEEKQ